jgi:hypothetical protein
MPSTVTRFSVESPPRMNRLVTPPVWPVCTTNAPGSCRSSSTTPDRVASASPGSTATGAVNCGSGVGMPVAVTVTSCLTVLVASVTSCFTMSVDRP